MADLIERRMAYIFLTEYYNHRTEIQHRNLREALSRVPEAQPEQDDMVDDLISFIEREKDKENRTLADWTVQWILEDIIAGKCKITGSATDHSKKKMYVEFSFYQEEQNEQKN